MGDAGVRDETSTVPLAERALWSFRLLLVVGVVGSAVLALAVMWIATVDLVRFVGDVVHYTADEGGTARSDLIATEVKIVDAYLLAAILVVVAFGLYELFVGRIDARRAGEGGHHLLGARSLDDLKDRIAKLVVLILVIEFFQRALKTTVSGPSDLLLLAGAIALVTVAVVLPTAVSLLEGKRSSNDS